ncbi:syndecan-2-A-like [Acanthochromis polyacanthus]|uniref:Syndecan n=1 Tax=Acanthochromis polyacanthus TaxID=80966 RepID=A0A3Q1G6E6_9TELE|nr:syndecan-2-A-like [Acanthochromis polyacanthus]
MRNLCLLFLVGLATGSISGKLFVLSQSSPADDLYIEGRTSGDLPIDDEDGEDDGSGSGSGDYLFSDIADKEEQIKRFLNSSREMPPLQPQPTDSAHNPPTTAAHPATTMKATETTPIVLPDGDKEVPGIGPTPDWFAQDPTAIPSEITTDMTATEDADEDKWDNTIGEDEDVNTMVVDDVYAIGGRDSRRNQITSPEEVTSENLWERTEVLAAVIACGVVGFLCAVFLLLLLAYRMKKKDEGSYDLGDNKLSSTGYQKAPTKEFYA